MENSSWEQRAPRRVPAHLSKIDSDLTILFMDGNLLGARINSMEGISHVRRYFDDVHSRLRDSGEGGPEVLSHVYRRVLMSEYYLLGSHRLFQELDPSLRAVIELDFAREPVGGAMRKAAAWLGLLDPSGAYDEDDYDFSPEDVKLVVAAVTTASVLPFIQSLATQAGAKAFDAIRSRIQSLGRGTDSDVTPSNGARVTIIRDETGLRFIVPPNVPDECLEALPRTDLESLVLPDPDGGIVFIWWDNSAREWKRGVQ